MSDIDSDVAAAFSDAPATQTPNSTPALDSDVADAFKVTSDGKKRDVAKEPAGFLTQMKNLGLDLAGGVAHGAGTLVDVARNDYRTFSPKPTIEYGGPESTARAWSAPFQHDPEPDVETDPKVLAQRAAPKLGDQKVVRNALDSPLGRTVTGDVIYPAADIGQAALTVAGLPSAARAAISTTKAVGRGIADAYGMADRALGPKLPEISENAQNVVNEAHSSQSMGAAATAPNVQAASPKLQTAISKVNPANVDLNALRNHLEAEEHGVDLMKGQANRDPVQFSEEQNQSTNPKIAQRLNQQNEQLTNALDNIRRESSPTTVGNDHIENGQAVVDSLKNYDEAKQADIRAKYKALQDANGSNLPIDTGSLVSNIDAKLKKGYLTDSVPPAAKEFLSSIRAGEPLDFEGFESARTRLAEAQRDGGSAGAAAKIIRGELEQMPLSADAAKLKGLANDARSAAKSRFDELDADPAYQAAVDDSLKVKKGTPSPIADNFLDRYALSKSAPKANLDTMLDKLDSDAKEALSSHTLNAVRKSAIGKNGDVLPAGYNGALQKLGPKLDSLVPGDVQDKLESLGRVITNAKAPPPGSSIAPKSGVIVRDAIGGLAEHALNAKTFGLYGVGKKVLKGDAFAKDALAPGAGIEK